MKLELIFCVECGPNSRTDIFYISKTINQYFVDSKQVSFHYICMDGKSKYTDKKVLRKIEKYRKRAIKGNAKCEVIYCFDTDQFELNESQCRKNKEIIQYCENNGFRSIWFCHDIEEVYLGESVKNGEKVKMARKFEREDCFDRVNISNINHKNCGNDLSKHKSNILYVLSEFLIVKDEYKKLIKVKIK